MFRDVVREKNILKGTDIRFKKNYSDKVIVICRDAPKCEHRVYRRWMKGKKTFQIKTFHGTHQCTRKYRSLLVGSSFITNKYIEQFKRQPNILVDSITQEVKREWKVDVNESQLYRARRKAWARIFGKHLEQYCRLWDYATTLREINRGSCIQMKLERIPPKLEPTF